VQQAGRSSLYCLNLLFSQFWEGKFVQSCSCTREDWLTNNGKIVSGISWESHTHPPTHTHTPFVPSRGGRIKKSQDIKAKFYYLLFLWNFAVSGDFLFQLIAMV